jgi:hypothetical protein
MRSRTRKHHPGRARRPGRAVLAGDTSLEVERLQVALWQRMSPLEKSHAVTEISRTAQELSLAGIRRRHPRASERECLLRLAVLKLGRELAMDVYPEVRALAEG